MFNFGDKMKLNRRQLRSLIESSILDKVPADYKYDYGASEKFVYFNIPGQESTLSVEELQKVVPNLEIGEDVNKNELNVNPKMFLANYCDKYDADFAIFFGGPTLRLFVAPATGVIEKGTGNNTEEAFKQAYNSYKSGK
jgi:hypothetical protein